MYTFGPRHAVTIITPFIIVAFAQAIEAEERNTQYYFSVEDNGPGIEPEFHQKIFVIFQTLQARDVVESTGVGLAIVKKIIEEQGGTVWIESDLGKGAKFCFTLPKQEAHKPAEAN